MRQKKIRDKNENGEHLCIKKMYYLQNTHKLIHQTNVIYAQMSDDIYDDGAQNIVGWKKKS